MERLRLAVDGLDDVVLFLPRLFWRVIRSRALQHGGWFIVLIALVLLYLLGMGVQQVANPEPGVPPLLADHQTRGPDEQRGSAVGATPSKTLPRPTSRMADKGIEYNFYGSPNWSSRGQAQIEGIVVHVTGPGTCPGMRSWFNNPTASVSAHFGVCKDGSIEQYVELGDSAWHAGICNRWATVADKWCGQGLNPNPRTVGIELLLQPGEKIEDYPELEASFFELMDWLLETTKLEPSRQTIIGHFEIDSVNRSVDPRCCVSLSRVVADLKDEAPVAVTLETLAARVSALEVSVSQIGGAVIVKEPDAFRTYVLRGAELTFLPSRDARFEVAALYGIDPQPVEVTPATWEVLN